MSRWAPSFAERWHAGCTERGRMTIPYIASTGAARDAVDLMTRFGAHAGFEATIRASRSRDLGNHLHFCRWREAGRLIDELSRPRPGGLRH